MPEKSAGALATPPAAALKIKPPKLSGTLYRGKEGMWSWVLHRITGVAIYFFLLVHILDTSVVRISPAGIQLGDRAVQAADHGAR